MARHQRDLYLCRNLPGVTVGRVCDRCDGKCPICDSLANPDVPVHICDECAYQTRPRGDDTGKCILCPNGAGQHDAYYCHECALMEKDRDGCPRVKNISMQRKDRHHEMKRYLGQTGS